MNLINSTPICKAKKPWGVRAQLEGAVHHRFLFTSMFLLSSTASHVVRKRLPHWQVQYFPCGISEIAVSLKTWGAYLYQAFAKCGIYIFVGTCYDWPTDWLMISLSQFDLQPEVIESFRLHSNKLHHRQSGGRLRWLSGRWRLFQAQLDGVFAAWNIQQVEQRLYPAMSPQERDCVLTPSSHFSLIINVTWVQLRPLWGICCTKSLGRLSSVIQTRLLWCNAGLCNREKWGGKKMENGGHRSLAIPLHSPEIRAVGLFQSRRWDALVRCLAVPRQLLLFQTRARQRERPPLTRLQQRNVPAPGFDGDLIVRIKTVAWHYSLDHRQQHRLSAFHRPPTTTTPGLQDECEGS